MSRDRCFYHSPLFTKSRLILFLDFLAMPYTYLEDFEILAFIKISTFYYPETKRIEMNSGLCPSPEASLYFLSFE